MNPTWLAARMRRCACGTWTYRVWDEDTGLHVDVALHPANPRDTGPYYRLIKVDRDTGPIFTRNWTAGLNAGTDPHTHAIHHCPPPQWCRWCGNTHQAPDANAVGSTATTEGTTTA